MNSHDSFFMSPSVLLRPKIAIANSNISKGIHQVGTIEEYRQPSKVMTSGKLNRKTLNLLVIINSRNGSETKKKSALYFHEPLLKKKTKHVNEIW